MLTCTVDEDCASSTGDGDLRLRSFLKLSGEVLQVLDDASLLDMEVLGVVP
jgi:hypothetical protein